MFATILKKIFTPSENALLHTWTSRNANPKSPAHWMPAAMLAWTFWLFFVPLFETGDVFHHWMGPTLVSFAVFLWLYFRIYYRDRAQVLWCSLGMAALGLALTPFNPGAQTYVIYSCAYLPSSGGTRRPLVYIFLVLLAFSAEWLFVLQFDWPYLINGIVIGAAIGFMNLNFVRKQQREAELRLTQEEVRRLAATAERERIGRDLHDLLGHTLSLIALKSELANRLFDRDAATAKREMAEVERVARDALAQVRRAVTGIRAAGIDAEVASAKLLLEADGVHLDYALADVGVPVEIETALAMAVREAVTNIQRHARAAHVHIVLEAAHGGVTLRIEDDGRGGAIVPGNGLAGMRERLVAIGAELRIDSPRGQGTRLTVTLPLPAQSLPFSRPERDSDARPSPLGPQL
ncbi:MAG: sensor histidine kinase [Rudaea sp.]|uniref:sensor histidine kinase n=1 Tax=Rudaea sp. TaxID=2136325 RepID=UPI0039E44D7E